MKPSKTTDKQFSLWLGEVLQPEKRTHSTFVTFEGTYHKIYKCSRCGKTFAVTDASEDDTCLYINPIPLDWPNAMKWRDWCVAEYGEEDYTVQLKIIWITLGATWPRFSRWLSSFIKPRHYLQAAAELKEKTNGK
ncbi:hypothetical protein LCGC14_1652440 [marine sediment metagenome]|uniref:Uncharacterized protein n=1 Tax=marine sediment metagenome TaxID=412755 RepID=A0A0F9KWQ4_9ZZZZ